MFGTVLQSLKYFNSFTVTSEIVSQTEVILKVRIGLEMLVNTVYCDYITSDFVQYFILNSLLNTIPTEKSLYIGKCACTWYN